MAAGLYSTGTIAVSNGSAAVTGTGTAWVGNVSPGSIIIMPNGDVYFVQSVNSNTSLTLSRAYAGTSQTGQSYDIAPTGGITAALVERVQELVTQFAGIANNAGTGKFGDGAIGAPGISFLLDQDTGLRRIASNALAVVAGGADQLILQGGVASGAVVQASLIDATANKLAKVGGFGGGGATASIDPPPGDNLNTLRTGGRWRYTSATVGAPASSLVGVVDHFIRLAGDDSGRHMQVAYGHQGEVFVRYLSGTSVWSNWTRSYDQRNLLGVVSQSGGIPTGAVIERGSNANGHYVRFADGTQICTGTGTRPGINSATGSSFKTAQGVTFPAAFAAVPSCAANIREDSGDTWGSVSTVTTTGGLVKFFSSVSIATSVTFDYVAIGRWF
jgi:hypothetical protein